MEINDRGWLPLQYAAVNYPTIRDFLLVFEAGIRCYPKTKGIKLLFENTLNCGGAAFAELCAAQGQEEASNAIESALNSFPGDPYITTEALLSATVDEKISLDCVYFVLRREPDVLLRL